jgi:hypothetical protein
MLFNATSNNISAILWLSVLFVGIGISQENHGPSACQTTLSQNVVGFIFKPTNQPISDEPTKTEYTRRAIVPLVNDMLKCLTYHWTVKDE